MEQSPVRDPARQAYYLLRAVFVLAPLLAGLDKFFHFLVDWNQYLAPLTVKIVGGHVDLLMKFVGAVEIFAGLGVLFKPRIFSYLVSFWLALIIVNLLDLENHYDVALRDFGLCLSALAMGRLSEVYSK